MAKSTKLAKVETVQESIQMTLEEAKAFRASLYKPKAKVLTEMQKREAFRIYWTSQRKIYGGTKKLENILWLHLKSINMTDPEKFHDGIHNFGLKKVK